MDDSDIELTRRVRDALDEDVRSIELPIRRRLAQARATALARRPVRAPWLMPAAGFATAASVLVLLLNVTHGPAGDFDTHDVLFDTTLAENELELIEDLEFYRWLDANGFAG